MELNLVPTEVSGSALPYVDADRFSYDQVSPEAATIAAHAVSKICEHQGKAAVQSGRYLAEAKAALGHGHFQRWLRDELNMTPRTAQSLMSVAECFGVDANAKTISLLPATALYTLAAPSTPVEARQEIIERINGGEEIAVRQIKNIVTERKEQAAEVARLAKMTAEERVREAKRKRRSQRQIQKQREEWRIHEEKRQAENEAQMSKIIDFLRSKSLSEQDIAQVLVLASEVRSWYESQRGVLSAYRDMVGASVQ